MDAETEMMFNTVNANLCAIRAVVAALVASHPDPKKLTRFVAFSAHAAASVEPLASEPRAKQAFQQCLDQLCAELRTPPDRPLKP